MEVSSLLFSADYFFAFQKVKTCEKKINISSSDTNLESDHGSDDMGAILTFILYRITEWKSSRSKAVILKATNASTKRGMPMRPWQMKSGYKRYNEEVKKNENLEKMLQKRLDGTGHVDSFLGEFNKVPNVNRCGCNVAIRLLL